jgi:short-subunit dehydrogenase
VVNSTNSTGSFIMLLFNAGIAHSGKLRNQVLSNELRVISVNGENGTRLNY